jgi:hypothetical protein
MPLDLDDVRGLVIKEGRARDVTAQRPVAARWSRGTIDPLSVAGGALLLFLGGCASMKGASQDAAAEVEKPQDARPPNPVTAPPAESKESSAGTDSTSSVSVEHPTAAPPASVSANSIPTKRSASGASHSIKPSSAPATAHPSGIAATTNQSVSAIDLPELERRLRDTRAIGVFTKLSLKNQVDDLLDSFRTLYEGSNKHASPELRQRYDSLLLKVLNLLQDGDPQLAATISSSRESIWGILADPDKFARYQSM